MLNEQDVVATVRRVELRELRLWVNEGWVKPAQGESGPVFDDLDVARIRLVCDLRTDMSLPDDAVPVVLSLLDQVHGLRRELRGLVEAVEAQPSVTKKAVIEAYRARLPDDD
ncbi:chaperone modulator CbpM [Aliiroseovarius sediminis]|uniref:chaperone modulator CbpM n=1 Tax=Aliiroseovarius sediminis TaxID=2925839 RepID=UPI001F592A76|nr:chaperone modulator CbpM [Aliiroseovarius sediminis]MCI2393890.1 chaperone modulator CbpM [Aliiroseovarius sediminis]